MLSIDGLEKRYGRGDDAVAALCGVSLEVERGQLFTLVGPSGCGKTTTLRCVSGLERPDGGEMVVGGRSLFSADRGVDLPVHQRRLGLVFQSYALWPHMNVFQTVAFPLQVLPRDERPPAAEIRVRVERTLATVSLRASRTAPRPICPEDSKLALARALVLEPPLLLMDEPLSNLDAQLREEMRIELKRLQRELQITVLYVTHDQAEALAISNRIGVMRDGKSAPGRQAARDLRAARLPLRGGVHGPLEPDRGKTGAAPQSTACPSVSTAARTLELESESALPPGAPGAVSIRAEDVVLQSGASLTAFRTASRGRVRALSLPGRLDDHIVAVGDRSSGRARPPRRRSPPGPRWRWCSLPAAAR